MGRRCQIARDRDDLGTAFSHPAVDLLFQLRQLGINAFEDLYLLHFISQGERKVSDTVLAG